MKRKRLSRKLPMLTLALGLTIGTLPGLASAENTTNFQLPSHQVTSMLAEALQPTYVSPQINTKSTNKVRVIVQLTGQPAAVGKYAAKQGISSLASTATESAVKSQQADVLDEASDQGINLQVNYTYNTVLNGFEVTIPANEIPTLAQIPGVKSIQENRTWYAMPIETSDTNAADPVYDSFPLEQIGANKAWAKDLTGAGLKVGVIDTGVDYTHPDIAPAYKGGYDSFYNDNDPYEEVPLTVEEDVDYHKGFPGTSHGTHVSGTIVGRFANKSGDVAQRGVAYDAELYVYKVLGRNLEQPTRASGSSAQVIDGIERAVKDGMDVINLSLGSDAEKDVNSPDAIAINNAVLTGVIAVIANGNAGPGYFTMGAPATSQLAIAVGAVTSGTKTFAGVVTPSMHYPDPSVTSVTYMTYGYNVMAWETGREDFVNIIGTSPQEVVYAGLGAKADYDGKNVTGKIVLVSRGSYAFVDKIKEAKAQGAKAIAIFNGRALASDPTQADLSEKISPTLDTYYGGNFGDSYEFIPTFDMKGEQGRALARTILENPGASLHFEIDKKITTGAISGDKLADFTSWGPNGDTNLSIKPDIMGPGVNVLSTWPAYGKGKPGVSYAKAYNRISGTSMATPHVAGLALLLKQAHPTWSPFDIRAALANTAEVLPGYDVYQQGPGRADVDRALETPALLQALEPITILDKNYKPQNVINYNPSASFGVVSPGTQPSVKTLQLKNMSSKEMTYTASLVWNTPGIDVKLSQDVIQVSANHASSFQLKLTVGKDVPNEKWYGGQVRLTSPGAPDLHLPFVVRVGDSTPETGFGVQEVALTNATIYPNRSQKSTTLSFRLTTNDVNLLEADVVDLNDVTIGVFDQMVKDNLADRFAKGVYSFNLTNEYYPVDSKGKLVLDATGNPTKAYLKDGIYKIVAVGQQVDEEGNVIEDEDDNRIEYYGYTSFRVDNSTGGGTTPDPGTGSGSGSSPSPSTPSPTPTATVTPVAGAVIDQGLKQVTVSSKSATADGVTTVTIADSDLKKAVESAGSSSAAFILTGSANAGTATKLTLTAEQIKQLQAMPSKNVMVVSAAGSAISIPVSVFTKAPAGQGFELVVKQVEDAKAKFAAKLPGAKVLGTPVAFEASWVKDSTRTAVQVPHATFIKRSFSIPGTVEPNTAGVLFEESGLITPVASVFTPQKDGTTIVTVSRPGFSLFAAVSRTVKFDDIAASWAASDITALANKLIIDGTSETSFAPKNNLTRAEFTALLVRSLGLRTNSAAPTFSDVKGFEWYASDIAAASQAGLIQGLGNGQFAPNANVTRQELTVILARALKLTGIELKASNPSFQGYSDDDQISDYAKESVKALSSAGIIDGDDAQKGQFLPTMATTRETVAAALHQLLTKIKFID
ncbi:S8 family serine peptidase [Paenibacillus guangzhouensis]|uniref:S8 family serine peptidase n=1 Tax=Paenibacillus guangzhouensis TaxID=1473112 RepID=UPI00126726EF|nr:S8 family serine peptidase [Paenibacillus guangzhouensis]